MKIQEVMKLQRKALGITQQDLADMSEIAISTIKKIESGKGNPSLSTVEKIMDILGMEVKYEIRQTVQTRKSNFQQIIQRGKYRLEFSCPKLFFASGLHLAPALWASMHIPPVNPVRTTS